MSKAKEKKKLRLKPFAEYKAGDTFWNLKRERRVITWVSNGCLMHRPAKDGE